MTEQRRDAAADLAMCERATPGPWVYEKGELVTQNPDDQWRGGLVAKIDLEWIADGDAHFIPESRTALPHWIKRAQEAEKRISAACDKLNSLITLISMAGGTGESVDIWGLSSELCVIASELNSE
jgi:hypothetical protein